MQSRSTAAGRSWLLFAGLLAACTARERRGDEPVAPPRAVADSFLEDYAETYRFRNGRPAAVHVTKAGDAVLFLRSGPRSFVRDLYQLDTATGQERVLLTAAQILEGAEEQLSTDELARRERMRIAARGITSFSLDEDDRRILVPLSGRLFVIERQGGAIRELESSAAYPIDPQLSPDGSRVAVARGGDLYVIDVDTATERRLTTRAHPSHSNGVADFIAMEEMGRNHGAWWSPDSGTLAYQETDTTGVETMHIAEPTLPFQEPQRWPYPRAGQKNARVRLGLISADGGPTTWARWDRERFPYLATVRWQKNAPLTILVQNRAQTEAALLTVDPTSGETVELLREQDSAWLDIDQTVPRWYDDGTAFLWSTERNGGWQLELRDRSGELVRPLTQPGLRYHRLLDVDAAEGVAFVSASPGTLERHLFRVPLSSTTAAPEQLSADPGLHSAVFGAGHDLYVQQSRLAAQQARFTVRRSDGSTIAELRSVALPLPFAPNVELTTVGARRRFHAAVVRPRSYDPQLRYPVIVYVYAGPTWQLVTAVPDYYLIPQWIADHGFVVVSLDGRGTPGRDRAWLRAIKGNFIEVALSDQVEGLQALGDKYPELDLDRVGVFGWSFGGYFSAMAVMQRGDVYHAAVAGAPVADWRDYDTHYTERYLGMPQENPDGYHRSSVLSYTSKLERPLLIVHGTSDDNVYFTHSLKLTDSLFRAGRAHSFLPLVGFTHMVPDPLVTQRLYRRILDHFIEHLGSPARARTATNSSMLGTR